MGAARPEDLQLAEQALNNAARHLAARHSLAELRQIVNQSREAFLWADQQAQLQPGPDALRRFRISERQLAEVERALALAEKGQESAS